MKRIICHEIGGPLPCGRRAVFIGNTRVTEWTDGDPEKAPAVPWLAKIIDDARADGMGEALETMRDFAHSIAAIEKAIAKRQAALRSGK